MPGSYEKIHEGHRARMRDKLLRHGAEVFDTYELLEMLLYYSIPYRDTNPTAKNLLSAFGSLDGVLSADCESLSEIVGVGERTARLINTVGAISQAILRCDADNGSNVFDSEGKIGDYLCRLYQTRDSKVGVCLLLFDGKMRHVGTEFIGDADFGAGDIKIDLFVRKAVEHNAVAAVIAHSHPYGPLFPTEADRELNKAVDSALSNIGILLLEHFIICKDEYIGFMKRQSRQLGGKDGAFDFTSRRGNV